tara:strand:- start:7110 stop:8282 length:1173 start_codon:yes stop_codon:yes gene_type:complete
MNVCHAFIWFSVKFTGGTTEFIAKICQSQTKAGIKTGVYASTSHFDRELASSLPETDFKLVSSYLDRAGFSIMPKLPAMADKELDSFDVVHMHVFRTFQNLVLAYYCRKKKIPYVLDIHGSAPYGTRKRWLKKVFDRFWGKRMLRDAAFLVAESQAGIDEYRDILPDLPDSKMKIIPPSFDIQEFQNLPEKGQFREKLGIKAEEKLIIFIGRLTPIKGLEFLIEAFKVLAGKRQDCRLAIIGDDSGTGYFDLLKAKVNEFGLSQTVLFTGFLGGREKLAALVDADLLAQTSKREQGPRVPFEAVLCGTSVIVTGHTGSGEAVRNFDAGETITYGNVDEFVFSVETILNDFNGARKRVELARGKISKEMSMEAIVRQYTDLYLAAGNLQNR